MFLDKQNNKKNKQKQVKKLNLQKLKDKNSDMDIEDMFLVLSYFLMFLKCIRRNSISI